MPHTSSGRHLGAWSTRSERSEDSFRFARYPTAISDKRWSNFQPRPSRLFRDCALSSLSLSTHGSRPIRSNRLERLAFDAPWREQKRCGPSPMTLAVYPQQCKIDASRLVFSCDLMQEINQENCNDRLLCSPHT